MLILIGLGIIDKNAPVPFFDWSEIRFVGVLQRIGFAGFIATILYLNFNSQTKDILDRRHFTFLLCCDVFDTGSWFWCR